MTCRRNARLSALFALMASPTAASGQSLADANACFVWTSNSLLANAYFQVAKNVCDYPIRIAYRYEEDVGAGCVGREACSGALAPNEIMRFTAGTIRYWACRLPAVARLPESAESGSCAQPTSP